MDNICHNAKDTFYKYHFCLLSLSLFYSSSCTSSFSFRTNSGQTLIFVLLYAKLLSVTKTRKQGLTRVSPISGVSQMPAVFGSRDIRQMDVQAHPHGSLFRVK